MNQKHWPKCHISFPPSRATCLLGLRNREGTAVHVCLRTCKQAPGGEEEKHFRSLLPVLPNSSFCHKRKSSAPVVQSAGADLKCRLFFCFSNERDHIRRALWRKYSYREKQNSMQFSTHPFTCTLKCTVNCYIRYLWKRQYNIYSILHIYGQKPLKILSFLCNNIRVN